MTGTMLSKKERKESMFIQSEVMKRGLLPAELVLPLLAAIRFIRRKISDFPWLRSNIHGNGQHSSFSFLC